jgi:tetratricopeptide (TPR) repeat protein
MVGATAALLPCLGERRKSLLVAALVTLFLCGAMVVANTSLSGLIALPLACVAVAFQKQIPGWTRFAILAVLSAGMLLGTGLRPDAPPEQPTTTSKEPAPSTTDVRIHLWNGAARMGVDRFVLGHGSGQFRVQYPRYRQPAEIEATSFGRRFSTAAESAHQDYLELFAEGGLLAFLLLAVGILQVLRQAPVWTWGPLLGFGFLAGVRSPLGNAPAAALLFLWMGTMLHDVHQRQERISLQFRGRKWVLWLLGLCALGVGTCGFLGQLTFTGYVREARNLRARSEAARSSLNAATFWNGYEQKFLQARAALSVVDLERSTAADRDEGIARARLDLEELLAVWPWDEEGLLLLGRSLQLAGKPTEAVAALSKLRQIDPQNPRATLSQTTILVEAGRAPEALVFLYKDLHPRLRTQLPKTLADLHAVAQRRSFTQDADLLLVEQAFFAAVDALKKEPGFGSQLPVRNYLKEHQEHPHDLTDMRPLVIYALQFLALKKPDEAKAVAKQAAKCKLPETYRRLMGDVLEPLLAMPEWQRVLR